MDYASNLPNDSELGVKEFEQAWKKFWTDNCDQDNLEYFFRSAKVGTRSNDGVLQKIIRNFSWNNLDNELNISIYSILIPKKLRVLKKCLNGKKVYVDMKFPINTIVDKYFLEDTKSKKPAIKQKLIDFMKNPFNNKLKISETSHDNTPLRIQQSSISIHELKHILDYILLLMAHRYKFKEEEYYNWIAAFFGYLDNNSVNALVMKYRIFGHKVNMPEDKLQEIHDKIQLLNTQETNKLTENKK